MSPSASVPNGSVAAQPGPVSYELTTTPFIKQIRRLFPQLALQARMRGSTLALALLILAAVSPQPSLAWWSPVGSLNVARAKHTATLLPNGKVLLVGGEGLDSAELYDQDALGFSVTSPMGTARAKHTATLLPNGKVLVVGGYGGSYLNSAQLYDPASGTWSPAGTMNTPRAGHTATLLPNGKVLVAGGRSSFNSPPLDSAQIYDPFSGGSGSWYTTPPMGTARTQHTATLLPNGKVLVAGGIVDVENSTMTQSAELYTPGSGWSPAASMHIPRADHTATSLPNGKVLVVGAADTEVYERYEWATNTWLYGTIYMTGRIRHTATLLPNELVLLMGGYLVDEKQYLNYYEIINPLTLSVGVDWFEENPARADHTATRLGNDKVLVAGGINSDGYLNIAKLYTANSVKFKLPPLLVFYTFEFGPRDVSGNKLHATVTGSPQPVPGSNGQGQAYSFNGATDYLTVPLDINPTQYPKLTMGCWVKTATLAPWWQHQPVLSHDNDDFDRAIAIDWRGNGFDLDGNPNAVGWSAFGGAEGQVLGGVPAILDQWTFVAVVYDQTAGTVKFRVDDMVFTKTGATLGLGRDKLLIGFRPATSSFPIDTYFAGAIDNVFVFGDALTDQQLAYIRAGGAQAIMSATFKSIPGPLQLLLLGD
ncbi:MAG: hypothetical protein FJ128_14225 [Deltaproteobacteria bacterium]|nr:hypothetical protein [Deltaproteobacteria bacterium]MBM4289356.1 hypothetical protein [Deltaproteobacteria bacterium]